LEAFSHILDLYPTGIVSIVSDTFNLWDVLTIFAEKLKPKILARQGKTVFRPDSSPKTPIEIICGDPAAEFGSHEYKGAIRLLDEIFGHTINAKGYKVLNEKVGLIYGDGMYFERYTTTLELLEQMGYAASNLVIGVGGILRNHSRDTMGFAIKATYVEANGEAREIEKDPITDSKKKSHKGLLALHKSGEDYITLDQQSTEQEQTGLLQTVFKDGELKNGYNFEDIRTF
jgi:nicotinamide phosphoribosyltransferase